MIVGMYLALDAFISLLKQVAKGVLTILVEGGMVTWTQEIAGMEAEAQELAGKIATLNKQQAALHVRIVTRTTPIVM